MIVCMLWVLLAMSGETLMAQPVDQAPVMVETTPASEPQVVEDESNDGRIIRYALIGAVVGGVVGGAMSLFGKKKPKT